MLFNYIDSHFFISISTPKSTEVDKIEIVKENVKIIKQQLA